MDAMADPNTGRIDDDINDELQRITLAIARELRGQRGRAGMSQEELARAAGMNKKTIGRFELGERSMTVPQLYRICRALGIKPSALIGAIDDGEVEVGIE